MFIIKVVLTMKKTKIKKSFFVTALVFFSSGLYIPQVSLAASSDLYKTAKKAATEKAIADKAEAQKAKKEAEAKEKEQKEKEKADKEAVKKAAAEKAIVDKAEAQKAKKEAEAKEKEQKEKEKADKEAAKKAATEKAAADKYEISYFFVYKNAGSVLTHYVPSGYMGDIGDIQLKQTRDIKEAYEGKGTSLELVYTPKGQEGWSGLYWLEPANNWGNVPGGFNLKGAKNITFWAKGLKGGEVIKEVKIGGITGKYPDSDTASLKNIALTKEWTKFEIDLKDKKMSHISGGFCVIFDKYSNPEGATVFIDDISYEIKTKK
jgi:hypothetical protein